MRDTPASRETSRMVGLRPERAGALAAGTRPGGFLPGVRFTAAGRRTAH